MRKRFVKILMLVAASVTMGAFVSCKDTSEDEIAPLKSEINELKDQLKELKLQNVPDNATLQQAIEIQAANLEAVRKALQDQLDAINSCECDGTDVSAAIQALKDQIKLLETQLEHKASDVDMAAANLEIQNLKDALKTLTDNYNAIQANYATTEAVKSMLQIEVLKLQQEIKDAKDAACKCDPEKLNELEKELVKAKTLLDTVAEKAEKAMTAATEAEKNTAIALEKVKLAEETAKAAAEKATAAAEAAQSAADKAETAQTAAQAAAEKAAAAEEAAKTAAETVKAMEKLMEQNQALTETMKKLIDEYGVKITELEKNIITIKDDVLKLAIEATAAKTQAEANAEEIKHLQALIAENHHDIDILNGHVVDIYKILAELQVEDQKQADDIKNLQTSVSDLQTTVTTMQGQISSLKNRMTEMEEKVKKALEDISVIETNIHTYVDGQVKDMKKYVDDVTSQTVADVKKELEKTEKAIDEKLAQNIKDVQAVVDKISGEFNGLKKAITDIQNAIASQIYGIEIQEVYNSWFGSVSAPFGISSNVLIAFYGEAKDPVYFPAPTGYAPYAEVKGNVELTDADMAMITECNSELAINPSKPYIKAGRTILEGETCSNAGKVYMTINPNSLDARGLQVDLVKTNHDPIGITLDPLSSSNEVLNFGATSGYGRAGGLYQAEAYLTPDNIDKVEKVNLETAAMKNSATIIKNIIQESIKNRTLVASKSDFMAMANDMREIVRGISLPKAELRAPWTDVYGKQTYTSSRADIAATAIQPLGLEQFKDLNYKTLPGYENIFNFLEKQASTITGKITSNVNGMAIFKGLEDLKKKGESITIKAVDPVLPVVGKEMKFAIKMSIYNDGSLTYDATTGEIKSSLDPSFSLKVDGYDPADGITQKGNYIFFTVHKTQNIDDMYNTIIGDINGVIAGTQKQVDTIVDFLQQTNKVLGQAMDLKEQLLGDLDKYTGDVVTKIENILSKVNDAIVGQINAANSRLQPILLFSENSRSGFLSTTGVAPTEITGTSLNLITTSWTLELAAPLARKHVAVVNVFKGAKNAQDGDADCKSALVAANNGGKHVNARLDGRTRSVKLENLKSGYTYEVAYSALDFHGKVVTRKYFFTVK